MPGLRELALQQILTERRRREQIIFVFGQADIPLCARAMKAGAVDFLPKPLSDADLIKAVQAAFQLASELLRVNEEMEKARTKLSCLTPRKLEVLRHIIAGRLNKQIASNLGTAEQTH